MASRAGKRGCVAEDAPLTKIKKSVGRKSAGRASSFSSSSSTAATARSASSNRKKDANGMANPPFPLCRSVGARRGSKRRECCFSDALEGAADLLRGRSNVLVLAGAGLSVSCGIPDFRSKGTGLYSTIESQGLGLNDPQELFDMEVFKDDPLPFYQFAKALYPTSDLEPSVSHRFLSLLHKKGMLLRVYTQNIDGLEEAAGVPSSKVINAHGSLRWAKCMKCRTRMDASEIMEDVWRGTVPRCSRMRKNRGGGGGELKRKNSSASSASSVDSAERRDETDVGQQSPAPSKRIRRKTSRIMESSCLPRIYEEGDSDYERSSSVDGGRPSLDSGDGAGDASICGGVIKPGVTFFGEKLDDRVPRRLEADREKADCLVVIGTSLSVAPMSKVIQYLKPCIPRILINRNVVKAPKHSLAQGMDNREDEDFRSGYVFDACLLGFCDDVTRALASKIGSWGATTKNDGEREASVPIEREGKLLRNVEDEYTDLSGTIHRLHNHPTDRVLLFPGAVLDAGDSDSDITYEEVAHCDGCQGKIEGPIMKCMDCFDYDLCTKCFPKISRTHHGGKHKFVAE